MKGNGGVGMKVIKWLRQGYDEGGKVVKAGKYRPGLVLGREWCESQRSWRLDCLRPWVFIIIFQSPNQVLALPELIPAPGDACTV